MRIAGVIWYSSFDQKFWEKTKTILKVTVPNFSENSLNRPFVMEHEVSGVKNIKGIREHTNTQHTTA
jgi:hypothetical protein